MDEIIEVIRDEIEAIREEKEELKVLTDKNEEIRNQLSELKARRELVSRETNFYKSLSAELADKRNELKENNIQIQSKKTEINASIESKKGSIIEKLVSNRTLIDENSNDELKNDNIKQLEDEKSSLQTRIRTIVWKRTNNRESFDERSENTKFENEATKRISEIDEELERINSVDVSNSFKDVVDIENLIKKVEKDFNFKGLDRLEKSLPEVTKTEEIIEEPVTEEPIEEYPIAEIGEESSNGKHSDVKYKYIPEVEEFYILPPKFLNIEELKKFKGVCEKIIELGKRPVEELDRELNSGEMSFVEYHYATNQLESVKNYLNNIESRINELGTEEPIVEPVTEEPEVEPVTEDPTVRPVTVTMKSVFEPVIEPVTEDPIEEPVTEDPIVEPVTKKSVMKETRDVDIPNFMKEQDENSSQVANEERKKTNKVTMEYSEAMKKIKQEIEEKKTEYDSQTKGAELPDFMKTQDENLQNQGNEENKKYKITINLGQNTIAIHTLDDENYEYPYRKLMNQTKKTKKYTKNTIGEKKFDYALSNMLDHIEDGKLGDVYDEIVLMGKDKAENFEEGIELLKSMVDIEYQAGKNDRMFKNLKFKRIARSAEKLGIASMNGIKKDRITRIKEFFAGIKNEKQQRLLEAAKYEKTPEQKIKDTNDFIDKLASIKEPIFRDSLTVENKDNRIEKTAIKQTKKDEMEAKSSKYVKEIMEE